MVCGYNQLTCIFLFELDDERMAHSVVTDLYKQQNDKFDFMHIISIDQNPNAQAHTIPYSWNKLITAETNVQIRSISY